MSRFVVTPKPAMGRCDHHAVLSTCPGAPWSNVQIDNVCSLWKGYGHVYHIEANDCDNVRRHVIIKHVDIPTTSSSVESLSEDHVRKVHSYAVESVFYKELSESMIQSGVNVPRMYHVEGEIGRQGGTMSIAMSDLQDLGPYYQRKANVLDMEEGKALLEWLARFHAVNWKAAPIEGGTMGLWNEGSFWQLGSRTTEFGQIEDDWRILHEVGEYVHEQLQHSSFRIVIHGDAKSANVYFYETAGGEERGLSIAGYDFQYCGFADSMRDVSYVLCCSIRPDLVDMHEKTLLMHYHKALLAHLEQHHANEYTYDELQKHFDLCVVDLARFMSGSRWWGNIDYIHRKTKEWISCHNSWI
jgi:hypothetical protein